MRVLFLHILPNIVGAMTVVATLEFGLMVLFEAGLSFLGLGVQPPTPAGARCWRGPQLCRERPGGSRLFPASACFC